MVSILPFCVMVLSLPIEKNIADLCFLHDTHTFTDSELEKQSLGWVPVDPICLCLIFTKKVPLDVVNGECSDVGE